MHGTIIKENAEYSGVRVTFVAMIQNARLPMQIDIGFGDVIYPNATIIDYPTMLDFEAPRLKGYPRETVIAEKFEAMFTCFLASLQPAKWLSCFPLFGSFDRQQMFQWIAAIEMSDTR